MLPGTRQGMALFLALCTVVLMLVSVLVVHLLLRSNVTHLDILDARLRAIYISEAGFQKLLCRLRATSWEDRWFGADPTVELEQPWGGGKYSTMIRELPGGDQEADIWVRGTFEKTSVVQVWRVQHASSTLNLFAQVNVNYFQITPLSQLPAGSQINPLTAQIEEVMKTRIRNEPESNALETKIRESPTLNGALTAMATTPLPGAVSQVSTPGQSDPPPPADPPVNTPALPPAVPASASLPITPPSVVPPGAVGQGSAPQAGTWWPQWPQHPWTQGSSSDRGWNWGWNPPNRNSRHSW